MERTVRLHSIQTMSTMDGPGIRTVFFFQGCPFRCQYCHNPDTWDFDGGTGYALTSLLSMISDYRPYYGTNGGVTVSGGECLFQADFLIDFLKECRKAGVHTAIDTSGMFTVNCHGKDRNHALKTSVFKEADLVLLDVKFCTEMQYRQYTAGTLTEVMESLGILEEFSIPVQIRQVIIPKINDTLDEMRQLKELLRPYSCIQKVELLPFRKLCLEKYTQMGLDFPMKNQPEATMEQVRALQEFYDSIV